MKFLQAKELSLKFCLLNFRVSIKWKANIYTKVGISFPQIVSVITERRRCKPREMNGDTTRSFEDNTSPSIPIQGLEVSLVYKTTLLETVPPYR